MTVALMYHALYRGDDTALIDAEDLPYATSEATFDAQLAALAELDVGLLSECVDGQALPSIEMTFDDGHASNVDIALPLLQHHGRRALLFVTTDFIGTRRGFCSADALRRWVDAGMDIGAHGASHRFFADLPADEQERELRQSRERLEDITGRAVRSMSFPGGRYTGKSVALARLAGYDRLYGSGFGSISRESIEHGDVLQRVAIRRTTGLDEFTRMISVDPVYYREKQRTQRLKQTLQRLLGNRLYHGLYKSLASRQH